MVEDVTLDTVHKLSTFELRQECEKRMLKLPERVTQATLMQTLIQSLVKDKEEEERQLAERYEREREKLQEELARKKAERKAAALERSKLRASTNQTAM